MSVRYAFLPRLHPFNWPRWILRALALTSECEIRALTRPGDTHPYLMATGRRRLVIRGVPLPWRPFRKPGAFQPDNRPGQRGSFA